jgi:hypothetical protein
MQLHGHGDSSSIGMALVQEIQGQNVLYALPQENKRWGRHRGALRPTSDTAMKILCFVEKPQIHNGADDNASGVAGLLELSERLANSTPLKSMLFAAFSGEEKGLWGSNQFCKTPTVALDSIDYMLNFDMIGKLHR